MEASLIYNPNSGGAKKVEAIKFMEALYEVGFNPVHRYTASEDDLDKVLDKADGLIVAVGGDGTARAVATRLLHRDNPLAFIPLGTANNIGRTLGIEGDPLELVKGLSRKTVCRYDVGKVSGPWGDKFFLEAMGFGLFADILEDYDPEKGKSVTRAAETVRDILLDYDAREWDVSIDEHDISGKFVALEVLNTKATGPRLHLAPDADPTDGKFDVICILEPEDVTLIDYATSLLAGKFDELPNVKKLSGTRISLSWRGDPLHVDDEVHGRKNAKDSETRIEVSLLAQALEVWLPKIGND